MRETLMLRSRVTRLCDYKQVDIASFVTAFRVDEERLARDMERRRGAGAAVVEASEAAPGDTLTISCRSELPRFNKENIVLVAGRGLFSRELEEQLMGRGVGGEYLLTADGAAVTVRLLSARRREAVTLSEEETARLRRACVERQVEAFFDEDAGESALSQVFRTVIDSCEFDLDRGEVDAVREAAVRKAEELCASQVPEETDAGEEGEDGMTPRQMGEFFVNMQLLNLKAAVVGGRLLADRGALPTREDYEASIARYAPAGADLDEERRKYPVLQFLIDQCSEYFCREIDAYACEALKAIAG